MRLEEGLIAAEIQFIKAGEKKIIDSFKSYHRVVISSSNLKANCNIKILKIVY